MIIRRKSIITSVPRARERIKRNLTTEKHEESQRKKVLDADIRRERRGKRQESIWGEQ